MPEMAAETISLEKFQALGESEAFLALQEQISRAAKTDRPVIFIGERGTGKELAAARLHLLSLRWNQSYVTLNCASLTPTLIESELFGHEAGAFTGAIRQRKGRFEIASGGSLFLDEVANIPLTVQDKILRVVEYGQMERVGSSAGMTVDVRLIAATNVDLRELARVGRFRQDLLDRLSFEVITLPPLRARREDILLLAGHFARKMAVELGLGFQPRFSARAEKTLLEHPWPGNVRELKNVVERMVYRSGKELLDDATFDPFESAYAITGVMAPVLPDEDVPAWAPVSPKVGAASVPAHSADSEFVDLPFVEAVRQFEIRRIRRALECNQFNQRRAADALGLTYHQFRNYYRKYRDQLS